MSEFNRPSHHIERPSLLDLKIIKALLGDEMAAKYERTGGEDERSKDAGYKPSTEELQSVKEAGVESKEYEKSAEKTKRLWMLWADKEGIDKEDIEENATFNQDGTVHWEGDCDWRGVTSLPPQLAEVTGYIDLRNLTTLEAGAIAGDVGGALILPNLTALEAGAIAGNVGGYIFLNSLTTLEAGVIAGNVGGFLNLPNLTTLEAGAIAGNVGGDLVLSLLTTLEAGAITGNVVGNVYLSANNFSSEEREKVKTVYPTLTFEFR